MKVKTKIRKLAGGVLLGAAAMLAFAGPAAAHVTVSPTELPAEGYAKVDLSVPHGCEASPTTSLSIQMPDQVISATPQVVPGWTITTEEGELAQPVESHGETITTGVREITWRGGPLDAHHLEVFGISVRLAGNPGDEIAFKAVQRCQDGQAAWIEVAETGDEDLEYPAPIVTLVDGSDDHGHGDEETADAVDTADTAADGEVVADGGQTAETSADGSPSSDDDEGNGPIPAIALVVAVLALITSGVSLTRRK